MLKRTGIIAGVSSEDKIPGPAGGPADFTAIVPLFDASKGFDPFRWLGYGTYDVVFVLAKTEMYVKRNVEIAKGITTLDVRTFTKQ